MKQLSQIITSLLGATVLTTTTVATTLQCKENEALLEVTYTLSEDDWKESLPGLDDTYRSPKLSVQPSGNYGMFNLSTVIHYENYTSLVDYTACIPKDDVTCFQVSIYMLPITSYEITYDGTVVQHDSDQDVFYDTYFHSNDEKLIQYPITSIEFGDGCYPVCNEEEHLFDHQQFLGYNSYLSHLDYNVKDDNDVVVLDCTWNNCRLTDLSNRRAGGVYRYRTCLPANKCYSLLLGNPYRSPLADTTETYGLNYNNEEIVSHSNTIRVSQTFFGDGCQPRCNEDESIVQLLGHFHQGCGLTSSPITLNWNISNANNEESLKDGSVNCNTTTSNNILFDEFVCVPRGMCTSVDFGGDIEGAYLYYTITMDDITYRNNEMRAYNFYNPVKKQRKTLLGNCSQSACNQEEDLIDISFQTVKKYKQWGVNQTSISSDMFSTPGYIDWKVDYSDNRYTEIQEQNARYFVNRYELDTKFRALMCIPSGNCLYDVSMTNDAPVLDYVVKQNGVPKSEHVRPRYEWSDNLISVTSLGTSCNSSSLSGGAIAGIVIASVVVFLALLFGGYILYKKKHTRPESEPPEEEPLL